MTRDEIIAAMHALEQLHEETIEVWRVIIAPDGTVIQRIYRGCNQPRDSHEPHHKER